MKENVGRQGQFPHGIDILTKCDYYAVGQLQHCYLNLSVFIAAYDEYRQMLIDHLVEFKFNHWDQAIRELTAQALSELTQSCPDYMCFSVMPKLIRHTLSVDLNTRHGALLCIAQISYALCLLAGDNLESLNRFFYAELRADLKSIVIDRLFEERYFRGSIGENMRIVVCFFLKKIALAGLHQHFAEFLLCASDQCEVFLTQSIEHNRETVQVAAVDAFYYFAELRFSSADQFR